MDETTAVVVDGISEALESLGKANVLASDAGRCAICMNHVGIKSVDLRAVGKDARQLEKLAKNDNVVISRDDYKQFIHVSEKSSELVVPQCLDNIGRAIKYYE